MTDIRIIQSSSEMTGGGVMTYLGLIEDGRYYVFSTLGNFAFCDADYGYTFTKTFFEKTAGDTYKWERKHYKESYDESKGQYSDEIMKIIEMTIK